MADFYDYWGKAGPDHAAPFHLLPYHALDVAAVGAELLDRDRVHLERIAALSGFSAQSLRATLPYHLALHDLGKFSEPFQDLRPEIVERLQGARPARLCTLRHDTLGYLLWRSWGSRRPAAGEEALLEVVSPLRLASGPASRRDIEEVMRPWMAAILGHHGKPPEEAPLSPQVFAGLARSRRDAAAFALAARELLGTSSLVCPDDDPDRAVDRLRRASWWVAGFTILCDWIGSNPGFFSYVPERLPLEAYWARARSAAAKAVNHSGLARSTPRAYAGIGGLFEGIAASPSPLQRAAAEVKLGDGPQLFVLEDLTGSGKTEAALVLAHRLLEAGRGDGIFFALPTMATANAMDARVKPLLHRLFNGEPSYLLTHSGPRLTGDDHLALGENHGATSDEAGEEPASVTAASWLSDSRKKALLAELGVGTIDQALLASLQSKHAALRLLGLHRHILVVDEVHACDAYMLDILCALLRAHAGLGGSAILLSATLPMEQRRRLARSFAEGIGERAAVAPSSTEYPLLTGFGAGRLVESPLSSRAGSARELPVRFHDSVDAAVGRLLDAARSGLCACWIRNSVADALEAFDRVAPSLDPGATTLFHARFALGDRLRIEREVVGRFGKSSTPDDRAGQVVIATQVVEQSLDIDFDVMVSDLCPIDRLIQRAGRLQRHERAGLRRPAPVLEILAPPWAEDPPAGWLAAPFHRTRVIYPDPSVLWRTLRVLHQSGRLALPRDARALVEAVYGDDATPLSLQRPTDLAAGQALAQASVAQMAVISLRRGYLRTGADWSSEARTPTRLGEPTTTVRLARAEGPGPWFDTAEPRLQWPLSQLSVARRLIAGPEGDDELRSSLEASQPFVGDDVVTVVLREQVPGIWGGRAVAERGRDGTSAPVSVRVVYSPQRGLMVSEGA